MWKQITHQQFEYLALLYAQAIYPNFQWNPTKGTRDDNHDFFYIEDKCEGWGEAKHSINPTAKMSKEKWDPTILSGKMAGNVEHILFVTNAQIPLNYVLRAELMKKLPFKKFEYITTFVLQKWLFQNKKILLDFFPKIDVENLNLSYEKNIEIKIHISEISNANNLKSNNQIFLQNKDYLLIMLFKSTEEEDMRLEITKNANLYPVDIIDINSIKIKEGITCIKQIIRFSTTNKSIVFKFTSNITDFHIKKIKRVNILTAFNPYIFFEKQKQIILDINIIISKMIQHNKIINLEAQGGNGKSYIFDQIIYDKINSFSYTKIKFQSDSKMNKICVCKLYLLLTFGIDVLNKDFFFSLFDNIKVQLESIFPNELINLYDTVILNRVDTADEAFITALKLYSHNEKLTKYKNLSFNSIILIEDIHKMENEVYEIYSKLLHMFIKMNTSSIIIQSYRPFEFESIDLKNLIKNSYFLTFKFSVPTYEERIKSVEFNFPQIKNVKILKDLLLKINNTLTLVNYLNSIHHLYQKDSQMSIEKLAYSLKQINIIDNAYFSTELFSKKNLTFLIFLIYGFENGFPISFIEEIIPDQKENLLILNDRMLIHIEDNKIYPFHDYYISAFLKNYNLPKFKKTREDIISLLSMNIHYFCDKENVLSTILKYSSGYEFTYLNLAIELVNQYYDIKDYQRIFPLISQIVKMTNISETCINWNKNKLWLCFIYADCLDHLSLLTKSEVMFEKVYYEGMNVGLSKEGFVLNAKAQILNLKFAKLQCKEGLIQATDFINSYPIDTKIDSRDLIDAKLTALNRKFVLELSLDLYNEALNTNNSYFRLSLSSGSKDHESYSYIDFARGIYHINEDMALRLMTIAHKKFMKLGNQKRRELDSNIEKTFLEFAIKKSDISKLEKLSNKAFNYGLRGIYKHCLLKLSACSLIIGDIDNASFFLSKLTTLYDIESNNHIRTRMLFYNQMSVIAYIKHDYNEAKKYEVLHNELASTLGSSYIIHNNISDKDVAVFNFNNADGYILESRIW